MTTRLWLSLAVVTLLAVPSFAQFRPREFQDVDETGWTGEVSYAAGEYMDNPCTAVQDLVWVEYSADVFGQQPDAGIDRYQFDESTTMSGAYATSGTSSSDVAYAATFSTRTYHKVNTSDNFHVVTVYTFNPATQAITITRETACGNGLPDSPQ
jgi:hypothetical protein